MTERLYYADAYLTSFDARVVSREGDGLRVYLDRSAFYPSSGGQPHDVGTIAGVTVVDVLDEDDRVAHVTAAPVAADHVHGEIDWPRRFDFMQQHTGQHLISAVFADCFGHQTTSVHFGPGTSTLDLDCAHVEDARLREVERRANEIVGENRAVTISNEEARAAVGLRKATERTGTIRVVTIAGIDRSACGGTHVRTTGEIGTVLLRRQEKVRGSARIEFVCGVRAIDRAQHDFAALSVIAQMLSCTVDDAAGLVESQAAQTKETQTRVRRLESELATYRAREQYDATAPDRAGIRRMIRREAKGAVDEWRALALAYCGLPKSVFIAATNEPPAVLLASSPDAGLDAGKTLKPALEAVGGRGGGSPRLAQGSVPSVTAIDEVLRMLDRQLQPGE